MHLESEYFLPEEESVLEPPKYRFVTLVQSCTYSALGYVCDVIRK